jgi:hypothetical protein
MQLVVSGKWAVEVINFAIPERNSSCKISCNLSSCAQSVYDTWDRVFYNAPTTAGN